MTEDPLAQAAERYLLGRHSTLFGRSWNIYEPEDREAAAAWLAAVIRCVRTELDMDAWYMWGDRQSPAE